MAAAAATLCPVTPLPGCHVGQSVCVPVRGGPHAELRALANLTAVRPYVPAKPTTITVELGTVETAARFRGRYGVEIVDPLKVVSRGADWLTAWNQIWDY